jgi:hypothetical protein
MLRGARHESTRLGRVPRRKSAVLARIVTVPARHGDGSMHSGHRFTLTGERASATRRRFARRDLRFRFNDRPVCDARWSLSETQWSLSEARWSLSESRWLLSDTRRSLSETRSLLSDARWSLSETRSLLGDERRSLSETRWRLTEERWSLSDTRQSVFSAEWVAQRYGVAAH